MAGARETAPACPRSVAAGKLPAFPGPRAAAWIRHELLARPGTLPRLTRSHRIIRLEPALAGALFDRRGAPTMARRLPEPTEEDRRGRQRAALAHLALGRL